MLAFEHLGVSKQGFAAIGNGPILERTVGRLRSEAHPGRWNSAIEVDRAFLDGGAREPPSTPCRFGKSSRVLRDPRRSVSTRRDCLWRE
jgi:hypothetical protein